jgi:hypothetical protein
MSPARLPKWLAAAIVVCVVSLVSAELLSFSALWWLEGRPFATGTLQAARSQLIAAAAERTGVSGTPRQARTEAPRPLGAWRNLLDDPAHARRVLHPYLGFVYDAALDGSAARRQAGYPEISDLGFYVADPGVDRGGTPFTVAIFGGSMAMLVALEGQEALLRELAASRAIGGRKVVIECYALGGYKQPQQLLALAYLLSLGEKPDIAVNLDGLNEIALPYVENRPRGVFPFFPRSWDALVQEASNPAALEEAGLVAWLRLRRVHLAQLFSARLLRISPTGNLVWRSLDRRLQRQIAGESLALARIPSGAASFAATGPPRAYANDAALFADLAGSWRTSSLLMARLAAGAGVRYYHFLQPNQFDPGAKPIGPAEAAVAADPASPFREPVRRGYPLLARYGEDLRRAGVRFHDLRTIFSRVAAPLYIDQCCHVSRQGNALLGEAIGKAIREDLDRPPSPSGGQAVTGSSR